MSSFSGNFTGIGETSATFSASFQSDSSGYTGLRFVRLYIEGIDIYIITGTNTSNGARSTFRKSISGLLPGTTYNWAARLGYGASSSNITWLDTTDSGSFTTEKGATVDKWSWNASNGSASAAQTRAAYSAINSKGKVSDFSYLVWNDMVDKVKEIFDAKGYSWNNNFASYAATKMSAGDKKLTATRFNSLRYNIGLHYSTGINTVYSGGTVYGWYFTTLTDCMNKMI